MKIEEMPSFFTYMSYMYFFPASLVGPSMHYTDYINYIEQRGRYANIPSARNETIVLLLQTGFVFSGLLLLTPYYFPWEALFADEFASRSIFYKRKSYLSR